MVDDHIEWPPPQTKYKPITWNKSKAKELLEADLATGRIPCDGRQMRAQEVYQTRPEYATVSLDTFRKKLAYLRKTTREANEQRAADATAYAQDRLLHPYTTHNNNGVPRWEGSDAQRFLKDDITAGLHTQMKPKELYGMRAEYYEVFSLDKFRGHIAQEVKSRKFKTSYFGR